MTRILFNRLPVVAFIVVAFLSVLANELNLF